MGQFLIEANGTKHDTILDRNRRGAALLQYLILEEGNPISIQRLKRELWPATRSDNPESALKTTISRLRTMLDSISPGFSQCIVSKRGTYSWQENGDIRVDVSEIKELLKQLSDNPSDADKIDQLLELYQGDLYQTGDVLSVTTMSNWLHNEFLNAIYRYIEVLKKEEDYERICAVCRKAAKVDPLDDQLHIELMQSLVRLNRADEARKEYQQLKRHCKKMLDDDVSEAVQESYEDVVENSKVLRINIDAIHDELIEEEEAQKGPHFCDYEGFKVIYNIYMRNLERLGSTMFLALIMLEEQASSAKRESCMAGIHEILNSNMRKGDIITRFSENMYAMLLPTVNYGTGKMVMERIEALYYNEIPNSLSLYSRIVPLGTMK